jgi:methylmalonyl-CoA/ethylmalonyl-CoA epimerase
MTGDELKQQLRLPEVGQIGVVVEDLDRAISFLESSFGLGPFRVQEAEAPNVWDRGEEKHIKARLGFAMLGQVELELIHIVEGDSVHLEFLREHGEGIHHLGFRVKDFEAKLQQARDMGLEVLQTGPTGRLYAYLDTRRHGGLIFELIEQSSGAEQLRADLGAPQGSPGA